MATTYINSPNTRAEERALTSNYTLKPTDSGVVFTNEGAAGDVVITIPNGMPSGLVFYAVLVNLAGVISVELEDDAQNMFGHSPFSISLQGEVLRIISLDGNDYIVTGASLRDLFIICGSLHGTGIIAGGEKTTYMWGENAQGHLGLGDTTPRTSPESVLGGHNFKNISLSNTRTTMAMDENGLAWGWGLNLLGGVGDGTIISRSSPVSVIGGKKFINITAGQNHSGGIEPNGFAWSWGGNTAGNLGDFTSPVGGDKSSPVSVVGGHRFKLLNYANSSHGLDLNGYAWSWGGNGSGQLGDGNQGNSISSPISVVGGHRFKDLATFNIAIVALDTNGFAWSWGIGFNGVCGDNNNVRRSSPVSVVGGHVFTKVKVGGESALALDVNGFAWSWGSNSHGQLGIEQQGTSTDRSSPVSVVGGKVFIDIECGEDSAFGLDATGILWGWGRDLSGNLGTGTGDVSSPVSVLRAFNI